MTDTSKTSAGDAARKDLRKVIKDRLGYWDDGIRFLVTRTLHVGRCLEGD